TDLDLLRVFELEFGIRVGDVLGDINNDRTGTTGGSNVVGLLDNLRNFPGIADHEAVIHDGAGNSHHVGFLEGIFTDLVGRYLTGQDHHGNGVHVGSGNTGNGVGGAGPG